MVKVSHARCRQCGQTRHRNARFNLCGKCWQAKKADVQSGWRTIKDRRALKRGVTTNGATHESDAELIVAAAIDQVLEEEPALMPRGRAPSLTPEQEAEIVNLYTTTDMPVTEIANAYGLGHTSPFRILSKNGVSWRRGDTRELPPHIEAMKQVHVAAPPAPEPTLEAVLQEEPMSTPAPEPVPTLVETMADIVANGQVTDPTLRVWRVEFSGFREVVAHNAREAIARAEESGAVDVTMVRLA